ncbi:hypothetical protein KSP39_PZI005880 [Platanthera zijinensis]|uniref:Uncharacterized protein n=1 Tax=Platanthera zijinensis TaxID=2320716 RepID=A0AAP0GAY0_9ASPA
MSRYFFLHTTICFSYRRIRRDVNRQPYLETEISGYWPGQILPSTPSLDPNPIPGEKLLTKALVRRIFAFLQPLITSELPLSRIKKGP